MATTKCNCVNVNFYCSKHSTIKMVFMLKTEAKTAHANNTFYSPLKYNDKTDDFVTKKMENSLKKHYTNHYWYIYFYHNLFYEDKPFHIITP